MNFVNAIMTTLVRTLMAPLAAWPLTGLVLLGLLSGIGAAVVFRFTSPQRGLRWVADWTRANLLAMKLFKDEFGVTIRALGCLMIAVVLRLLFSLPPMLVLVIPFTLLLSQMAMWYEFRAPRPGEPLVVEAVVLPEHWDPAGDVRLEVPAGVQIETEVISNPARHSYAWRIRASQDVRRQRLTVTLPAGRFEKVLTVQADPARLALVSPKRPGPGLLDRILYSAEPGFDTASPVQEISVRVGPRKTPVFGWNVPWWLTFFVFSIVGALLIKPFVKVQF